MKFEFATATRILFGPGRLNEIGSLAKSLGKRALVITGRNPQRAERFLGLLKQQGVTTAIFRVVGEPEIETVLAGIEHAKQNTCDIVISLGGGSPIDAGKAIAAMLNNEGELLDYLEIIGKGKPLEKPSAPFIAIPTTAGTGSEVTRNSVLASPQHKVKVSLRSPFMLPSVALVDPELTYDLPHPITASTGLDALTQLIEPYVSCRSNPLTDAISLDGLRRAAGSLRIAYEQGSDAPAAREEMAMASLNGGLALANAGLGAVHGFAGPIGGMFPAPHGAVCAALLAPVIKVNLNALRERLPNSPALERYENVACLLTNKSNAKAEAAIEWIEALVRDFQIPHLRAYGIRLEDIDALVSKASNSSSMKANPIVLTPVELRTVLESAL
jgi:alcohol dehydrogenase class IV